MLTEKQTRFIEAYLASGNATQAAIQAGYPTKSAQQVGSENLLKPVIQEALKTRREQVLKVELGIDPVRTLREVGRVAFFDPIKLFNDDGSIKPLSEMDVDTRAAIASIQITKVKRGTEQPVVIETTKIHLNSKLDALDKLMKHQGLFAKAEGPEDGGNRVLLIEVPEGSAVQTRVAQYGVGGSKPRSV